MIAFLDDAERFLSSRWAKMASAMGWTSSALFGVDPGRGLIGNAQLGLLWHLEGGKITELHGDGATIERGGHQRAHARRLPDPAVHLPWALDQRPRARPREEAPRRFWVRA